MKQVAVKGHVTGDSDVIGGQMIPSRLLRGDHVETRKRGGDAVNLLREAMHFEQGHVVMYSVH
jgi:hypothetical protein